jgi:hypothetical protein
VNRHYYLVVAEGDSVDHSTSYWYIFHNDTPFVVRYGPGGSVIATDWCIGSVIYGRKVADLIESRVNGISGSPDRGTGINPPLSVLITIMPKNNPTRYSGWGCK